MSLIGKVPLNLDFDLFTSIYSERLNLIISVIPYIDILKVAHHDSMVEVVVLLFTVVRNAILVLGRKDGGRWNAILVLGRRGRWNAISVWRPHTR